MAGGQHRAGRQAVLKRGAGPAASQTHHQEHPDGACVPMAQATETASPINHQA